MTLTRSISLVGKLSTENRSAHFIEFDPDDRGRTPPPDARAKAGERKGARAMTFSERLKVHADIERQNREKCESWFQSVANKKPPFAFRLNKRQYLAVLDNALIVVTENDNHKAERYLIFGKGGSI